jgi:hypothetical protein
MKWIKDHTEQPRVDGNMENLKIGFGVDTLDSHAA